VLDLLNELTDLINELCVDNIEYESSLFSSWGDEYTTFDIYINREETDEEYQARLQSEAYRQKQQDERDKRELDRLMIKFKKPSI
jgi:hypothetical protein